MGAEAPVGLPDKITVEAPFALARFIPSDQQNRHPFRIKGESYSLHSPSAALKRTSFMFA
jgi:hypothetical protein